MNIDTSATTRPRPWLLIVLGLAVIGLIANYMWPASDSAGIAVSASNQNRTQAKPRGKEAFNPSELDVKLETLDAERPGPAESERNPFRFQPKAAPPPPRSSSANDTTAPPAQTGPPQPPPPTPIPLKFIGTVEKGGLKVAAMSDCKGNTFFETEGKIVDGRYRLVRIQLESIVMEYPNGTGRTTIRLEGCPAR